MNDSSKSHAEVIEAVEQLELMHFSQTEQHGPESQGVAESFRYVEFPFPHEDAPPIIQDYGGSTVSTSRPLHFLLPQKRIPLYVDSETGILKQVVIGRADTLYKSAPPDLINEVLKQYEGSPDQATAERAIPEFRGFEAALRSFGVEVYYPEAVRGVPDQLPPRDIGMVIGSRFIITSMAEKSRQREIEGLGHLIEKFIGENPLVVPQDIVLEGGDVLLDGNRVYVGYGGQRSNRDGADWLAQTLGNGYEVIPIELASTRKGEDVLHLDCTMNLLGSGYAVVYRPGFVGDIPKAITDNYRLIELTQAEQAAPVMGTNFLSVDPETILAKKDAALGSLYERIRATGINVVELKFDEAPKTGGSLRCCSLPLYRE